MTLPSARVYRVSKHWLRTITADKSCASQGSRPPQPPSNPTRSVLGSPSLVLRGRLTRHDCFRPAHEGQTMCVTTMTQRSTTPGDIVGHVSSVSALLHFVW